MTKLNNILSHLNRRVKKNWMDNGIWLKIRSWFKILMNKMIIFKMMILQSMMYYRNNTSYKHSQLDLIKETMLKSWLMEFKLISRKIYQTISEDCIWWWLILWMQILNQLRYLILINPQMNYKVLSQKVYLSAI